MLIDEQIKLELGEDYNKALDRARKFIAATCANYKRWGLLPRLLDNEGGRAGVLRNCLLTIIEVGEIERGLERWASRLAQEYVNGRHNEWDPIKGNPNLGYSSPEDAGIRGIGERSTNSFGSSLEPSGEGSRKLPEYAPDDETPLARIIKTHEEYELYNALASVHHLKEAAELIGMPYSRAKKLNNRVWQRVRYHVGKRGYLHSSVQKSQKQDS